MVDVARLFRDLLRELRLSFEIFLCTASSKEWIGDKLSCPIMWPFSRFLQLNWRLSDSRLCKNLCLLVTALFHFIHNMVNPVLMSLSASHNLNSKKHFRALGKWPSDILTLLRFLDYLTTSGMIKCSRVHAPMDLTHLTVVDVVTRLFIELLLSFQVRPWYYKLCRMRCQLSVPVQRSSILKLPAWMYGVGTWYFHVQAKRWDWNEWM